MPILHKVYNPLQFRGSPLQVDLEHATAADIHENGSKREDPVSILGRPRVPDAFGLDGLVGSHDWQCPPGMTLTAAAIGHVPEKKEKHTRPVYLLSVSNHSWHQFRFQVFHDDTNVSR